jgi:tetratricopeptide (TPR) repeat protein
LKYILTETDYFVAPKGPNVSIQRKAGNIHKEVYDYFREKEDKGKEATALHQIGNIYYLKGEYEEALDKYTKSLEIEEGIGDKSGIDSTLGQIGRIKHRQEKYHEAIAALATAASIFKELELPYFELIIKNLAAIKDEIADRAHAPKIKSSFSYSTQFIPTIFNTSKTRNVRF